MISSETFLCLALGTKALRHHFVVPDPYLLFLGWDHGALRYKRMKNFLSFLFFLATAETASIASKQGSHIVDIRESKKGKKKKVINLFIT